MTRTSTAPLALVTAAITVAPPALGEPTQSTSEAAYATALAALPAAPALPAVPEARQAEWSCVASARLRGQFVGTAWSERASTREAAATDALQRCSRRAGSRTCEIRHCWSTPGT
jgi:hypothetical protein